MLVTVRWRGRRDEHTKLFDSSFHITTTVLLPRVLNVVTLQLVEIQSAFVDPSGVQ